jgi:hypothetical protein
VDAADITVIYAVIVVRTDARYGSTPDTDHHEATKRTKGTKNFL